MTATLLSQNNTISENLLNVDGGLYLLRGFFKTIEADFLFDTLLSSIPWKQEKIFIYGRWTKVPRLMSWHGDNGSYYLYSGVNHPPLPWTQPLLSIKQKIESFYHCSFNSVMANLYRTGSDSMGCHADNETELGLNPLIASLSLGEERLLKFRHNKSKAVVDIFLSHGDLLLMTDEIQSHWRHELPKTKKTKKARINLTFRKIIKQSL